LVADTQEILRRSKQREHELEQQLDEVLSELEEADLNYDKMVDLFAESQRTVEKMRTELSIGAQLVQKVQDEKVLLMKEIDKLSQQNMVRQESENQSGRIRDLFKTPCGETDFLGRRPLSISKVK